MCSRECARPKLTKGMRTSKTISFPRLITIKLCLGVRCWRGRGNGETSHRFSQKMNFQLLKWTSHTRKNLVTNQTKTSKVHEDRKFLANICWICQYKKLYITSFSGRVSWSGRKPRVIKRKNKGTAKSLPIGILKHEI